MKGRLSAIAAAAALMGTQAAWASEGGSQAGDPAAAWNHLWHHLLIDLLIIGVVFGIMAFYWAFKYRTNDPNAVGQLPKLSRAQAISWALVPAFVFMADDFYLSARGWTLWNLQRTVPEGAMEVKVTGSKWMWEFEYEDGAYSTFTITEDNGLKGEGDGLVVPVGTPVVLRMTSTDVVHSFFLPNYRVKEDLMPGRVTYLWFNPKEETETFVTCTEYCGNRHSYMYAPVKVVSQEQFEAWKQEHM